MENLFIPVLLGSGREGRMSEKAARCVYAKLAELPGVESVFLDVRDFDHRFTVPPWGKGGADERPTTWKEIMGKADGLVIVSPEYNHGYPGELKLFLDTLYDEYARKPLGICGVSSGALGGGRMVEQLRLVAIELKMVPLRNAVYFPNVKTLFGEDGSPTDPSFAKRLEGFFAELLWYARVLKPARAAGVP